MAFKVVLLCLAVALGSNAFPIDDEQDMSIFFDRDFVDSTDRIVGGTQAGSVEYMVALTTGTVVRGLHCGGSILSPTRIATAAHCLSTVGGNRPVNTLRGGVGTNRWNSGGTWFTFQRGIMHPAYNAATIKNDIALVVPSTNIVFTAAVRPVVLSTGFANAGLDTIVNGWGRTAVGGSASATLLELRARVVDGPTCVRNVATVAAQLNIRAPAVDPNLEICTFAAVGRGTCHGDSGSALVRADNRQQIGLVSWGLPCARGAPDMFVRVSTFTAWIRNNS